MKKLLLMSFPALLLALQSVASADHEKWEGNFRLSHKQMVFQGRTSRDRMAT